MLELTAVSASLVSLSEVWRERGVSVRPSQEADEDFHRALFFSVRAPEFMVAGWPEAVLRDFLAGQSQLQRRHYANVYSGALTQIVTHDGTPIGRLILYATPGDIRVVDISLLPDWRGGGLGSALLEAVETQAVAARVSVSLSVDLHNPARRLYLRRGFVPVSDDGMAQEMRLPV